MTDSFEHAVISGMISQSNETANDIIAAGYSEALLWATRYRELWNKVYDENDSLKVHRVLTDAHYPTVDSIDHYKEMGGNCDD